MPEAELVLPKHEEHPVHAEPGGRELASLRGERKSKAA